MKNPLIKRLPRELKADFGKYTILFIFLVGLIGIVSGFLIASSSMIAAYDESFEKYNIEDGNFEYSEAASDEAIENIENEDVTVYENYYFEEETGSGVDSTLRVFKIRTEVDKACLMEGEMPANDDEIAIDRMYADNNNLEVGNTLEVGGKELKITGLIALSDYSALFQNTSDMMFDSIKFGVAVMTDSGFEAMESVHMHYSYSWIYDEQPKDDEEAKEMSEDLLEVLAVNGEMENFIPEYSNQAIHFTGDDFTGDKMYIYVLLIIVIIVVSFAMAITISNTIAKEATVIGALRASGYRKNELIMHYMAAPVTVTLLAAIVGNILGYTYFKDFAASAYYGSYSLPTFVTQWNAEAFLLTTIIPLVLLIGICFVILKKKLNLSPMKFLRRDLSTKQKKKAFRLNTKIPILRRFKIRVIFQNIPNFLTIFVGTFISVFLLVFALGFKPLLLNYQEEITSNMLAKCQYVLKTPVETENEDAEKICVSGLKTTDEKYLIEDVTIYGIEDDSEFVDLDLSDGKIYFSNAYTQKHKLEPGDKETLKEEYGSDKYEFEVAGSFYYPAGLAVFMSMDTYEKIFDTEDGYFNGYFSNEELDDIDEKLIATEITKDDLTKTSRQLILSMGDMMYIFDVFALLIFVLIIFLLAKVVIEKNSQSISMTKILGYSNKEISSLYMTPTTIAVLFSLLVCLPVCAVLLKRLYEIVLASYSGWFTVNVPLWVYGVVLALGIVCYFLIAALLFRQVKKIPMDEALKNVE